MLKVIFCLAIYVGLCFLIHNPAHWLIAGLIIAIIVEVLPKRGIEPPEKFKPSWDIVRAGLFLGFVCWVVDWFVTDIINFVR